MRNIDIASIVNSYTAQKEAVRKGEQKELRLPAKVAWIRRVNMDKLFRAKKLIDDAIQEVNEAYADDEHSDEKDGTRTVKPEYRREYFQRQGEILTQKTDVVIKKVRIEDLGDIDISDSDMDTLAFMIEGGE